MTDYKSRLISYISSMTHAKAMLEKGIINRSDFLKIDTIIAKKYGVDSCNIYRGIDLIYTDFRGNIGIKGGDIIEGNQTC